MLTWAGWPAWLTRLGGQTAAPPSDGFVQLLLASRDQDVREVVRLLRSNQSLAAATLSQTTPLSSHVQEVGRWAGGGSWRNRRGISTWCGLLLGIRDYDNHEGMTALHVAAFAGAVDIVTALLDAGASADAPLQDCFTPLFLAAMEDHTDVAEALLTHPRNPASVNSRDLGGGTALHVAVGRKHLPTVQLLLAHGADIALTNYRGFTAVHAAAKTGEALVLVELLSYGPALGTFANGATPVDLAVAGEHVSAVKDLAAAGAPKELHTREARVAVRRNSMLKWYLDNTQPTDMTRPTSAVATVPPPEQPLDNFLHDIAQGRDAPTIDEIMAVLQHGNMGHPDSLLHAHRLVRHLEEAGLLPTGQVFLEHLLSDVYRPACWAIDIHGKDLGRCVLRDAEERSFLEFQGQIACANALDAKTGDLVVAARAAADTAALCARVAATFGHIDAAAEAAAAASRRDARLAVGTGALSLGLSFLPVVGDVLANAVAIVPSLVELVASRRPSAATAAVAFSLHPVGAEAARQALVQLGVTPGMDEAAFRRWQQRLDSQGEAFGLVPGGHPVAGSGAAAPS